MLASVLIIAVSLVLLVYWFRYSCLLLLRDHVSAAEPDTDPRFHYGEVRQLLQTQQDLDPLQRSLDRDYRILCYLLEHAAGLELRSVEDRLLLLDYRVMQWWYRLTKTAAPQQARHALSEMASILGVLVQKMGRQAGIQSEA